jgi:hypothetical protein
MRCEGAALTPGKDIQMTHRFRSAAGPLITGILFTSLPFMAHAHGVAGARLFVSTMLIDDPNVADEATVPLFFWLPQPTSPGVPAAQQYQLNVEWDKRITENFGFALNTGYSSLRTPGQKTANGWQNLEVTLKWKPYVNAEHEFMMSVGVTREFARTGANGSNGAVLDNDDSSSTTPTFYFGKGIGDLPIGYLRPLAITGTIGYTIADKKLKATTDQMGDVSFNNGAPNQWTGGMSLQYSMLYLATQVKDFDLPEWVNRLTPLVEATWSSSASKPNNTSTQYLFGVGVSYTARDYAISAEVLIPGNRQTGSHLGFVAEFHLYFDDMFPNSLGKPLISL